MIIEFPKKTRNQRRLEKRRQEAASRITIEDAMNVIFDGLYYSHFQSVMEEEENA